MRAHPHATTHAIARSAQRPDGPLAWGQKAPTWGAPWGLALLVALTSTACPAPPAETETGVCALPAPRARRLSVGEVDRSVRDLFPGVAVGVSGLPPDPRPAEFDNDVDALQPSALFVEGQHNFAIRVAQAVVDAADTAVGCDVHAVDCAEGYANAVAARAFRRAVDADEAADLHSFFTEVPGSGDPALGLQLALEYVLQSPGFLYREDVAGSADRVDAVSLASRLSYFLWGSLPDQTLLDAAQSGGLDNDDDIAAQVRRMLDDPRAEEASVAFHRQWLDFERLDRTIKDATDDFPDELKAAFAREQEQLVRHTLFGENGDITALLTSRTAYLTPAAAAFYGVDVDSEDVPVELGADRAGYLRRGGFLAAHAHPGQPSPVWRGVFVLDRLLCTKTGVPPAGVDISPPQPRDDALIQTNREVVDERTAGATCQSCHGVINPIGYALEGYDTVGRVRTHDHGLPIDDNGLVFGNPVHGADGLVAHLVEDERVERCAVQKLLIAAWGDTAVGNNRCLVDDVLARAPSRGTKDLLFAIATHPSFRAVGDAQ